MSAIINYEGVETPPEQIDVFREVLESNWLETLALPGGVREWNRNLLAVTEGRRTIKNADGTTKLFYSWCGDWVTHHLERAGCLHGLALNRQSLNNSRWQPGMNLTWLRAWAGEPALASHPGLRARFKDDTSSGFGPSEARSFHAWDNERDVCSDGYVPQLGDLLVIPRKNGDHIEFFVKRSASLITVCAGAQLGGTAQIRQRNLHVSEILAVIDISRLVTSEPF